MGEGATLDSGDLAGVVLDRARPTDVPTIITRALSRNLRVSRHRHVHPFSGAHGLVVRSRDERPLPLQVDGDYIGESDEAVFGVHAERDRGRVLSSTACRCAAPDRPGVPLGARRGGTDRGSRTRHRASPARLLRAARCSRPTTHGTSGSTASRWPRDRPGIIARIGLTDPVHPDFGSGLYGGAPIGIPYAVVSSGTRRVPVSFQYASESDRGPYPLPRGVPIEGGYGSSGDRHVIVVDRNSCRDYELFAAYPHDGGKRWTAGSGAIFNLRSDHLRPAGWTSADAAGLPILPGLARYERGRRRVRSTTRCASPRHAPRPGTCIRRATKRLRVMGRTCRPWAFASA